MSSQTRPPRAKLWLEDDEHGLRLRPPRKIRRHRDEIRVWSRAFSRVQRLIQMNRRRAHAAQARTSMRQPYMQRCSVRVTYLKNKSSGQWKAHGRYIQRETATRNQEGKGRGFEATSEAVNIPRILNSWQTEGDARLFKIIVSPEFGDQLDLVQHTRELMQRMEVDLNTVLEWVAAAHYNTDHPHVHIALRGKTAQGRPLHLPKEYIKMGIRQHAETLATNQIGYRTPSQVLQAQNNEVEYQRRTSLDDLIAKRQRPHDDLFARIQAPMPLLPTILDNPKEHRARLVNARLRALSRMGLARRIGLNTWEVRTNFRDTLKGMQKAQDRQRVLAKHGVLSSDERLQVEVTELRQLRRIDGRVLVHDEEQDTMRPYMLIEGTDGKIHMVYHTDSIQEQRAQDKLRPGHFVILQKQFIGKRPHLDIQDIGEAHAILSNQELLRKAARWQIRQGLIQQPEDWKGWLGRYQSAVQKAVQTELERSQRSPSKD